MLASDLTCTFFPASCLAEAPGPVLPRSWFRYCNTIVKEESAVSVVQCLKTPVERDQRRNLVKRRDVIGLLLGLSSLFVDSSTHKAGAAGLPPEVKPKLCDDACEKELENVPMVTTGSGLQYKDIKVGGGPSPPVGFQVAANYVAMVPSGQVFDSSLEKGQLYIFRIGSGQLAFPKGLNSAPGRPRVAANSPVIFDVSLEYVPGLDLEIE